MRDRSLDEFLDAGTERSTDWDGDGDRERGRAEGGSGAEPAGPGAGDEPPGDGAGERGGGDPDDRAVEPAIRRVTPDPGPDPAPATSTYAFSPEGATCAACGARAERRWRDEAVGGLVCGDCKRW